MPFSTCWCVFTLPAEIAQKAEEAFRAEVVSAYPSLADDSVWQAGMRRAVVVWTVNATVRSLPRTVEDGPMHRTRRPVATRRQVLRHRWQVASTVEGFPAFAQTVQRLLREVAREWDVAPLPRYPAFSPVRADQEPA
ncbi:hypothetical protein ABZW30_15860 [Kitasatospora sp. NPDC004669]|uniref:hypothetical protein n=1 Tax=Kitasatospora sp. NPDC004669 TaxID=3154555 RepID=UPI0033B83CCA